MSPGSSKEKKDKKDKPKKKSSRTVWTVPTEKPWARGCSTPTLPLYNPPPSTPVKGTSISKLKEMNGWKWTQKHTYMSVCVISWRRSGVDRGQLENHQITDRMLIDSYMAGKLIYFSRKPTIMWMFPSTPRNHFWLVDYLRSAATLGIHQQIKKKKYRIRSLVPSETR